MGGRLMKHIGKLFPIALVLAVLILGSSTALAPSVTPTTSVTPAIDESAGAFTAPTAAFDAKQTTGKAPFNVSFTDKTDLPQMSVKFVYFPY